MKASATWSTVWRTGWLVLCLSATAAWGADEPKPKVDPHLVPLARFSGEWTVAGKWAAGNELHARTVYEWGLGGKILRAKTFVKDGETEYQRYEATFAWHPAKLCLYEISFAVDGAISEHKIETPDDQTLLIDFSPLEAGGRAGKLRQTLKFVDNDHFTWKIELNGESGWQTILDATWVRKK